MSIDIDYAHRQVSLGVSYLKRAAEGRDDDAVLCRLIAAQDCLQRCLDAIDREIERLEQVALEIRLKYLVEETSYKPPSLDSVQVDM